MAERASQVAPPGALHGRVTIAADVDAPLSELGGERAEPLHLVGLRRDAPGR